MVENATSGKKKEVLATVPDLISILDSETGEVIPTEEIRYGPQAFGYKDYSYHACEVYKESNPIPLTKS